MLKALQLFPAAGVSRNPPFFARLSHTDRRCATRTTRSLRQVGMQSRQVPEPVQRRTRASSRGGAPPISARPVPRRSRGDSRRRKKGASEPRGPERAAGPRRQMREEKRREEGTAQEEEEKRRREDRAAAAPSRGGWVAGGLACPVLPRSRLDGRRRWIAADRQSASCGCSVRGGRYVKSRVRRSRRGYVALGRGPAPGMRSSWRD